MEFHSQFHLMLSEKHKKQISKGRGRRKDRNKLLFYIFILGFSHLGTSRETCLMQHGRPLRNKYLVWDLQYSKPAHCSWESRHNIKVCQNISFATVGCMGANSKLLLGKRQPKKKNIRGQKRRNAKQNAAQVSGTHFVH